MPATLSLVPADSAQPAAVRHVHRVPDKLAAAPRPAPGHLLLPEELSLIAESFKPYVRAGKQLDANEQAQRKARLSDQPEERAKLPELVAAAGVLKEGLSRLRGDARVAVLDAIAAAARR